MNAYNLILNRQDELYSIAQELNMPELVTRSKEILNKELFTIIGCNQYNEITKICKNSTGEIFESGQRFWSLKYNEWYGGLYFDKALTGTVFFGKGYTNYVRAGDGGLYHLSEISTTEPKGVVEESNCQPKTITLDNKEYFLIEKTES